MIAPSYNRVKKPVQIFFPLFLLLTLALALGASWMETSAHDVDRPLASQYGPGNTTEITQSNLFEPVSTPTQETVARQRPIEIEAVDGFGR